MVSENMGPKSRPLVSIAIPLYHSLRFVENIVENIESLDYTDVEIIISDRHCHDQAIDLLQSRYPSDPRLRFLKSQDRLGFVEHYNLLLREASGKYFLWMPHDDSYPTGYVSGLVSRLEREPDAVLAFGRMEAIGVEGDPLSLSSYPVRPFKSVEYWSQRAPWRLLILGEMAIPFRGLFRRDAVLENKLFLRPTLGNVYADAGWVFGLSLIGRLCFVHSCRCRKRYYTSDTHPEVIYKLSHVIDSFFVLGSYVRDYANGPLDGALQYAKISSWTLLNGAAVTARRVSIPRPARKIFKRLLVKIL